MMEQMVLSRKIIISQPITDVLADSVIEQLLAINDYDEQMASVLATYTAEPIEIFINSGGGSATAGFAIIGAMEMCTTPIVTYGMGIIASMALGIFLAGDVRIGHRFARFMYHGVQYGEEGFLQDHIDGIAEVSTIQEMYNSLFLENTNFPRDLMKEIGEKKQNYFFSAKKAKKYGVVHEVLVKPQDKIKALTDEEFQELEKAIAEQSE